jgi:hypothetical protein
MWDEDGWESLAYGDAFSGGATAAPPPRPRDDTSGKWQYFRLVCSPNPGRAGRWEWTPEEVAARASVELGRDVPLHPVGSTLTKLQNKEGLLLQRSDGHWPAAPGERTHRRRLYLPTQLGRAVAAQMGLPREDRPGPPSAHGRLPAELVLRVLASLPLAARARAACVCRAWRGLCATPALWAEVHCGGDESNGGGSGRTTRAHALAAVARAGGALRSLHAGRDVLSAADLADLLCGGACPALEHLVTATATGDRCEGAIDFDVPTGRAILAACPALRMLNCRLGVVDAEDAAEEGGGGGVQLEELCAFLRHPAVRCETLLLAHYEAAAESEAAREALDAALRAQADTLTRLVVGFVQPWLVASLVGALPALRALQSLYLTRGVPAAVAAALGGVLSLARLHADVDAFEEGALAALGESLEAPGSGVYKLMIIPYAGDAPPPHSPPPDAAVALLAAAVARRMARAHGSDGSDGDGAHIHSFYFETLLDNGHGVRLPLLTGGGAATAHFAAALQAGLPDIRIGPLDAGAAAALVNAAARSTHIFSSLVLALSLLDGEAADAAAYAARALLLLPPEKAYERTGEKVARVRDLSLVLDDAPLSAAASRDLAATLHEGVSEVTARALHMQICATITEAAAAGPVSAAFARAFAQGAPRGWISRLNLKIQGPWSDAGAQAWTDALDVVRTDMLACMWETKAHKSGLGLLWDLPATGCCPLCGTRAGARLVAAAARLCAATFDWAQPYAVAVRCVACATCMIRHPASDSDHHRVGNGDEDEDGAEDEEEEEEEDSDEDADASDGEEEEEEEEEAVEEEGMQEDSGAAE